MKKKILLTVSLLTVMFLVSGCMMVSGSRLESMFGTGNNTNSSSNTASSSSEGMVTITKAEYDYLYTRVNINPNPVNSIEEDEE